jgi:hypothetical protein
VASKSKVAPSHVVASSGGGGDPSSVVVFSTAPSVEAASPHEARTTNITSGALEV